MTDNELIDAVWDNINDEINEFRRETGLWTTDERSLNEDKINFYEGMTKYLATANLFTDEYKNLYRHGKTVLRDLWNFSCQKGYRDCDMDFVYECFILSGEEMSM